MFKNNLGETLTVMDANMNSNDLQNGSGVGGGGPKSALDYSVLYTLLDVLDSLGLILRKADSQCNQRFLTWHGFKHLREKA